ncbi:hypothetical protein K491DRAFT_699541 [Lophiostoma macrostomum CBS 122681]|uniref:Uncharacterized protein n=1 Tax=Lophiostoma macrostomum CBS 122681 TaxID=1314788 RepID=A0A6A6SJK3_9PLEO|nr:hypothetical protein K491DRAFT_699541 [Lophiostoma macrostomum CBS 122681]
MSARRPLQPLSPLSASYNYITKVGAHVESLAIMNTQARDENTQNSGSIVSDITGLENDADDDFDKLMMQNARDERRLQEALKGNIQPFRKARTHPRVALTLDNLDRKNAEDTVATGTHTRVQFNSPSSSSGSVRSDPAVRPPAEWGRKARVKRNWLRAITPDVESDAGAQDETINRFTDDATPRPVDRERTDIPRPSIEDSPLSRKSSLQGTPASTRRRNAHLEREPDWDFTMDFNEASMIASTPYKPRNTVLDDIRQREIENLKEQALTTNRLDRIREDSPEETRRRRSSSTQAPPNQGKGAPAAPEQTTQVAGSSSEIRLRKRTGSWKTLGRSQPVLGEVGDQIQNSPIVVYKKSSETVGLIDPGLLANGQTSPQRPMHRREDSQDLLRRLARVSSNTPSPGRVAAARPQTAPSRQEDSTGSRIIPSAPPPAVQNAPATESTAADNAATAPGIQPRQAEPADGPQRSLSAPALALEHRNNDIDVTPLPLEPSALEAKTPVVTGAWVDTPGPRTSQRPIQDPQLSSPLDVGPSEKALGKRKVTELPEEQADHPQETAASVEPARPTLPRSALEAIIEEAKANGRVRQYEDAYGDSTIDSLEDLIAPIADDFEHADADDDTLQNLQVPTDPPRTEAERQRQRELAQLYTMNQKLRAARTSIRDASRGIKRVENRVDHGEDSSSVKIIYRDCPCGSCNHTHTSLLNSLWTSSKRLFYEPSPSPSPTSPSTPAKRTRLTWLSIALLTLLLWFLSESIACEKYCHRLYGRSMVGFGVDMDAPRYPYVLPTLLWRKCVKPVSAPVRWIWSFFFQEEGQEAVRRRGGAGVGAGVPAMGTRTAEEFVRGFATKVLSQAQETWEPELRMGDDEVV